MVEVYFLHQMTHSSEKQWAMLVHFPEVDAQYQPTGKVHSAIFSRMASDEANDRFERAVRVTFDTEDYLGRQYNDGHHESVHFLDERALDILKTPEYRNVQTIEFTVEQAAELRKKLEQLREQFSSMIGEEISGTRYEALLESDNKSVENIAHFYVSKPSYLLQHAKGEEVDLEKERLVLVSVDSIMEGILSSHYLRNEVEAAHKDIRGARGAGRY